MEAAIPYLPLGGLIIFGIGSIVAVKVGLGKKPSYKEVDKIYVRKEVCNKEHEYVKEKLDCIPEIKETVTEIKTKIDILLAKK